MEVREQEIALRNEGYSVEHDSLSAHPLWGKGVLASLKEILEMIHLAAIFLHTYYVPNTLQGTQVWLQNFHSASHLLTIFILNLTEKELPSKNQFYST